MPDRIKDIVKKDTKSQKAFDYLVNKKGYDPVVASGIVGNLRQESSFVTTAKNPKDPGTSFGLAQWNRSRKDKLFDMYGDNPSFYQQLDYIDWELNNTESNVLNKLKEAKTPTEAALIFSNEYERPSSNPKVNRNDLRVKYSNMAFNNFSGKNYGYYIRKDGLIARQELPEGTYNAKRSLEDLYYQQQTDLTNLENAGENDNFVPEKYFQYVLNTPVEKEDKKESAPKKEQEVKTDNSWKQRLQKKINHRRFLMDLISSGYIDYKRPEYQFPEMREGGQIPVATTPEQQYNGLNNNPNEQMYFPMEGVNTFRGLDNGQPVQVTDQQGNTKILYGPKDQAQMVGNVKERKI